MTGRGPEPPFKLISKNDCSQPEAVIDAEESTEISTELLHRLPFRHIPCFHCQNGTIARNNIGPYGPAEDYLGG